MKNDLNINKLIEDASDLIRNPQLGFAAEIQKEVQEIIAPDGTKYYLFLRLSINSLQEETKNLLHTWEKIKSNYFTLNFLRPISWQTFYICFVL